MIQPLSGQLTAAHASTTAATLGGAMQAALRGAPSAERELVVDLSAVTEIDSAGAALLVAFVRRARAQGCRCRVQGLTDELGATLELLPYVEHADRPPPARPALREKLGESALGLWSFLLGEGGLLRLCADVAWFTVAGLLRPGRLRWHAVGYEMAMMGSRALGVVGLIAFLVGGTMALQAAAQLRQFGANIFVVDLVAISITRELGPLMTAIVVAGRSGSAVAAELGTMVVTEEVDALRTMGIHPVRFLMVPKVLAITVVQPLLTVLANALAIAGALVVAVTCLDVAVAPFISRLQQALMLKDLLTGLFKSILFANLIVSIGAVFGLRTRGGADAVGRNTTASVVAAIFAVIVADALCSLVFYMG